VTTTSGGTASITTTTTNVIATTEVSWDAATWLNAPDNWYRRKVYFSDNGGAVSQIQVSTSTVTVTTTSGVTGTAVCATVSPTSASALRGLGLGGSDEETSRIVRWMLGDPTMGNPAVLGGFVGSVPIDVGPPGYGDLPGAKNFMRLKQSRPNLVYVGTSDGMLHAFHSSTVPSQWAGGQEAFAFIPRDMIPVIARLYAQGGQRYSPDDHIYGLAGSPKVKNLCVANCNPDPTANCSEEGVPNQPSCPVWKTVLIMTAGAGGNHPFVLDITDVITAAGVNVNTETLLNWHAGYGSATTKADYRVIMTSGYPYADRTSTATSIDTGQGRSLVVARAYGLDSGSKGLVTDQFAIGASSTCSSAPQEFTLLADVAVATNYTRIAPAMIPDMGILAAYFGDTHGRLHQYTPSYSPQVNASGTEFPIQLGCEHPLHFPPAVVQLNRFDSSFVNDIFLVQVTNSVGDPLTRPTSADFPASKLAVVKVKNASPPRLASSEPFGTGGIITLTAGRQDHLGICGVTTAGKTALGSTCGDGGVWLPATARPSGRPTAIIRSDGAGFQVVTLWYDPPAANWDTCPGSPTDGKSYIVLHEFLAGGGWVQVLGKEIPHDMVTGIQFVGSNIFYSTGDAGGGGAGGDLVNFGQQYRPALSRVGTRPGERFQRTAWTERIDVE
jgi:hypothetical protein